MTQLEKNKQGKMLDLNFELQLQKKKKKLFWYKYLWNGNILHKYN